MQSHSLISRREFGKRVAWASMGVAVCRARAQTKVETGKASPVLVALVKTTERAAGLKTALELLGAASFEGQDVYLKGSFNSADPFPATTHLETLRHVSLYLKRGRCGRIILVERSGMGPTREIWEELGVPAVAKELGVMLIALEETEDWRREEVPASHWSRGIEVPNFLNRETRVVQVANLKTHRFGGQFSSSLKNSIGLIAKHSHSGDPHNYMEELHASPNQRLMVAEVNHVYNPALVVVDAMQVFVDGGPEAGEVASPGVFFASRDRIAIDAAGVALLRHLGVRLSRGPVFELEQIKRASELNLGAKSGDEIKFLTSDSESATLAATLKSIVSQELEVKKG